MVKILQAYNFAKQNTFTLNGEILSATLIGKSRIAVSSKGQFIEIYDINSKKSSNDAFCTTEKEEESGEDRSPQKYLLPTVGEVCNLIYCEAGNYLLTLEKENSSPVHSYNPNISCNIYNNTTNSTDVNSKMFVRIYVNFLKFPESTLVNLPITIRIASMTTPKQPLMESIDVIEIPMRSAPNVIQCCQVSGNVIVSSKERIYLFECVECIHESLQQKFSYIDFFPFKFYINLSFVPLKLCIAENVIACMNNRYCVAFKVVDVLSCGEIDANNIVCDNFKNSTQEPEMDSKSSESSSSHNSFETDSGETISSKRHNKLPVHNHIDFGIARLINSIGGHEFEVDIKSQWDDELPFSTFVGNLDAPNILISPAKANDIKIKLIIEADEVNTQNFLNAYYSKNAVNNKETAFQYDIRRLLQICMKTSDTNGGRIIDVLRCMDLKAIYQHNDDTKTDNYNSFSGTKNPNCRSLRSNIHNSCIGYALLVTSSVDGYLYQFCSQEKWYKENEKPVATYSFTAPVLQVHIDNYVIFGVTTESVETHSSRIGHKVFNNRFEYPSFEKLFSEEYSPDVKSPIIIIGLCSFTHVQYVCFNSTNLVMIINGDLGSSPFNTSSNPAIKKNCNSVENKRNIASRFISEARGKHNLLRYGSSAQQFSMNEWTLYNLELPNVENIVEDLSTIADSYRSDDCSDFYDIMEEAHVILRLSLSLRQQLDLAHKNCLRLKFLENCRKLADFSIRSKKKEVYSQATCFYKMCNIELIDIYKSYIANLVDTDTTPDVFLGLIYTTKLFLLSLGADRLKSEYLSKQVNPFFTKKQIIDREMPVVSLSLELLNMFIEYSPAEIPKIMLHSTVLADLINSELLNYLKNINNLNPEENLLYAVTSCRMSNYVLSQEIVSKMSRASLALVLLKYKNVLFEYGTNFSKTAADVHVNSKQQLRSESPCKENSDLINSLDFIDSQPKIISFSEFTENILFTSESQNLIDSMSDIFIHALCTEHSITLDMILDLFLNYIASHIGRKGCQTSQKIFTNILQVYYYMKFENDSFNETEDYVIGTQSDYIKDQFSNPLSNNSECDNLSLPKSFDENNPGLESSIKEYTKTTKFNTNSNYNSNSKFNVNDALYKHENQKESNEVDFKGLKILFRMYMGRLKVLSSDTKTESHVRDVMQQNKRDDDLDKMRKECIQIISQHLQELRAQQKIFYNSKTITNKCSVKSNNRKSSIPLISYIPNYQLNSVEFEEHIKSYIRPIPCLLERPQYLNRICPFLLSDFSFTDNNDGECKVRFQSWNNELLTQILKIQSLLASNKILCDIVEEFLAFIQKEPNLIGTDSFLIIILPKNCAISYMLSFCPEYLWHFGKSNNFTPRQWESLLRKILNKKELLPNWKNLITDILNHLVTELNFEELLQCFPTEYLQNQTHNTEDFVGSETTINMKNDRNSRNILPMDNINENNVFELILRKAVSKQRIFALRSMIESTGFQLFDATSNTMYNL